MHREQIIVVLLSTVFAGLAALMSYLIAYEEYSHHFPDARTARRMALESAVAAFIVFAGLGLILGIALPRIL